MFAKLFRSRAARDSVRRRARRPSSRPTLETLEDRFMPSTYTWAANGDGVFDQPANWKDQNNQPGVPGVGDTAIINYPNITVSLSASAEVHILQDKAHMILPSGNSLTVDSASYIQGGLDNAGTLDVNNPGTTLILSGASSSSGTFNTADPTATLEFYGNTASANWNAGINFTGNGQLYVIGAVNVNAPLNLTVPMRLDSDPPRTEGDIVDNGNLTIAGTLNWTGGTIGGSGVTQLAGSATTTIDANLPAIVDTGHVLQNAGTVNWVGGNILYLTTNSTFTNQASGTFNATSDALLQLKANGNGTTFANQGIFNETSLLGTGVTQINGPAFNNANAVHVSSGTLGFYNGTAGVATSSFQVDAGGTLGFYSGAYTFNAGASISGTGLVYIATPVSVNEPLPVANVQVDGGSGNLIDDGNVTINGSLNWTGGTIGGTGTTQLAATSTTTINSSSGVFVGGAHLLQNAGTVNWVGGSIGLGTATTTFTNQLGGLFNAACDSLMRFLGTFTNAGVFNKTSSASSGTTTISGPAFNNTGTVNVQSGILNLATGGTATGGQFITASGQMVEFTGSLSTYTLNTGTTFSGPGTPDASAGTLNVNGAVAASVFQLDGGTLSGTGNLTTSGTFTWTGGAIADPNGHFTIPVGATFNIQGNAGKTFRGGTLDLSGTTNWMDSGAIAFSSNATITNELGAVFNIRNDQTMSGMGIFTNNGLLSKLGGSSTTTLGIRLNSTGHVEVHSHTLAVTGSIDQVSGTTLSGGTWAVFGSAGVPSILNFPNAPAVTTIGTFAGVGLTGTTASFTNLNALNTVAGQLVVSRGQAFTTTGPLTVTGGLVIDPTSTVMVVGDFTLAASATLTIKMGGTNAKPTLGHLAATGTVTLAGKLAVTSTVKPTVGTIFTLLDNQGSAAVSGVFAGLPDGSTITVNGAKYQISYFGGDGNDVTLKRLS